MKKKHFENWSKTREKGRSKFILINGLLAWGLPMFLVMTFIANKPDDGQWSPTFIAFSAVLWALGGLAFGYFAWGSTERAYKKELAKQ
ncbi:hypothetical protein [Microbulbifer sp. TRSA005]|uniref:hypothetical protein n=1 Tax=unclassified Microbulbifer TaxID=2619833 RepID=UPI00403A0B99